MQICSYMVVHDEFELSMSVNSSYTEYKILLQEEDIGPDGELKTDYIYTYLDSFTNFEAAHKYLNFILAGFATGVFTRDREGIEKLMVTARLFL